MFGPELADRITQEVLAYVDVQQIANQAGPLRTDLLRPGQRHPQPGLRQRRVVQGHPESRGHAFCNLRKASAATTRTFWSWTRTSPSSPFSPNSTNAEYASSPCGCAPPRPTDYKTITLDRSGLHNRPRVHEWSGCRTTPPRCQLVITGLGRDAPTVIITNDTSPRAIN